MSDETPEASARLRAALIAADATTLADYLVTEQAQTGTALLRLMPAAHAAAVLERLPEALATEIAHRLPTTEPAAPAALERLAGVVVDTLAARARRAEGGTGLEAILAHLGEERAAALRAGLAARALKPRPCEALPPGMRAALRALAAPAVPPALADAGLADAGLDDADRGLEEPGGGGALETGSRVLTAEEIDRLLGCDATPHYGSGIEALINSPLVNYERLPMLEVVFDRLARRLGATLRDLTGDTAEVSLDQIASVRFGDYLNSICLPALQGVFRAEEWDGGGLAVFSHGLVLSLTDALLGGRRAPASPWLPARLYTDVERSLAEMTLGAVLDDLAAAFDPISPVTFRHERLETNPRFAAVARPAAAAVLLKLRVDLEEHGGRLEICLPYATLEPVRELLLQTYMGERFGRDTVWEGHLSTVLPQVQVRAEASLPARPQPLGAVLAWQPGVVLPLAVPTLSPPVTLAVHGTPIATAALGARSDARALCVEHLAAEHQPPTAAPFAPCVPPVARPLEASPMSTDQPPPLATPLEGAYTIPVDLRVVLGSARLTVADILKLGRGAIIELDRRVAEPVSVYAGEQLIARGEIVVVEDRLGVSLTEIAKAP